MNKIERAELIQHAIEIRNHADALLDLLIPDGADDGCPHPAASIEDVSTLDDNGERYRCTKCGAESTTPFPSIINKD